MFGLLKKVLDHKYAIMPINEPARRRISFLESVNATWIDELETKCIDEKWKTLYFTLNGKPFTGVIKQKRYERPYVEDAWKIVDGLANGFDITWYESGKIQSERFCKDGRWHGRYAEWNEGGYIRELGNYENGLKQGEFKSFDTSCKCIQKRVYKDNKIISNKALKYDRMSEGSVIPTLINGQEVWEDID